MPNLLLGTRTGTLILARQVLAFTGLLVALALPQPWPLRGRENSFFFVPAAGNIIMIPLLAIAGIKGEIRVAVITIVVAGLGMAFATLAPHGDTKAIKRKTWELLLLLAGALLLSVSVGSHAGAVPGSVWTVLGDYVHLIAASAWVGGLVLLPILLWQSRHIDLDRRLILHFVRRFSNLAGFSIFVLAFTGLFNSLVELPNFTSLWNTPYGQVLLLKLFLIILALEVAFFNNRLTRRHTRSLHHPQGLRRLNRQVALEATIGLGIVLSVAVLVQTPAPRGFSPTVAAIPLELPFNTISNADDLYVHLQVRPNQVGSNRFWVHLYHSDGSSIGEVQLVRLLFNYREVQIGQANVDLESLGQDTFAIEGAYINQAGMWDLSVYVRRRGIDDSLAEISLEVPVPTRNSTVTGPWQNPIPTLPPSLLIAGALVVLGAIPLIWRRPLRAIRAHLSPAVTITGGMLILLGLIVAANSTLSLLSRTNTDDEPVPANTDSIAIGATLYQEQCAICHGVEGLGNGPLASNLQPPPASLRIHIPLHDDRELYGYVSKGFPGTAMPAFEGRLTREEIWHLVNYLRDEFGTDTFPTSSETPLQ